MEYFFIWTYLNDLEEISGGYFGYYVESDVCGNWCSLKSLNSMLLMGSEVNNCRWDTWLDQWKHKMGWEISSTSSHSTKLKLNYQNLFSQAKEEKRT